jgi:adenine deaminase
MDGLSPHPFSFILIVYLSGVTQIIPIIYMTNLDQFINDMPKAELHLHIEGTFEPEQMFEIAGRNGCKLKYESIGQLKAAYNFNNLQEFLDIYYEGANVLIKERDFYDLAMAYFHRANQQKVLHAEIFFDPQTHTSRGVSFATAFNGIYSAMVDAKKNLDISTRLILCFLRHLDASSAMKTLEEAIPFRDRIIAVGLDSSEMDNPPEKFKEVFERARQLGFLTVAHAGEEGPASYVRGALEHLCVDRIDHGNRSIEDPGLITELVDKRIAMTICPLSNLKLKVVKKMEDHPLHKLLKMGLAVTVNSDDPAYFGGYINENYRAVYKALNLTKDDIVQLAQNSFEAAFITDEEKKNFIGRLTSYVSDFN